MPPPSVAMCVRAAGNNFFFGQAHHLQFDTLRRAKHATTMLCYAMHNPTASMAEAEGAGKSAAKRLARKKAITLHMRLLLHTATCDSTLCHSLNCRKMKVRPKTLG